MFQGYYLKFGSHFSWPWNLAGALLTLKGSGSKPQGNLDNLRRSICIVDDDTRCQGNPKKTISILSWNWQLYKQRTDHQDVYTHRVLTTTTKYPQNTDKYQQNTDKYWQILTGWARNNLMLIFCLKKMFENPCVLPVFWLCFCTSWPYCKITRLQIMVYTTDVSDFPRAFFIAEQVKFLVWFVSK